MKLLTKSFLFVMMAFIATSCIDMDVLIKLNKDGSGEIIQKILMDEQKIKQMEAMSGGMGEEEEDDDQFPYAELDDETIAEMKAEAMNYGEGVKFVSAKEITEGPKKGVKLVYSFEDINKVKAFVPSDSEEDKEGKLKFVYKKGELKITNPNWVEGKKEKKRELSDEEKQAQQMMMQMMKPMFEGMKIRVSVQVEGKIKSTNVEKASINKVHLIDLNMEKIMDNPETFSKGSFADGDVGDFAKDWLVPKVKEVSIKF